MRTVQIDLCEILDLVTAAEDYGYNYDVLMCSLAEFAGLVTDDEIREFCNGFLTEGSEYGQEDADTAVRRLTEWRDKYRINMEASNGVEAKNADKA